jgi:ParB-like chromosome segregation protein Spo0J
MIYNIDGPGIPDFLDRTKNGTPIATADRAEGRAGNAAAVASSPAGIRDVLFSEMERLVNGETKPKTANAIADRAADHLKEIAEAAKVQLEGARTRRSRQKGPVTIDGGLALVLLKHLGVELTKHRDGTFTGAFGNCTGITPSFRCEIEKTTPLVLLRHCWEGDIRRVEGLTPEQLFDSFEGKQEYSEKDEAELRTWFWDQVALMDERSPPAQTPPATIEPRAEQAESDRALHPLCELFPPIEGTAFDELVASIKENGLQEPITVIGDDEAILDGRNRYNACLAAGVEAVFVPFRGDDPVRFVLAANVHRRHLDASQRAVIAAKIAVLQDGQRQVGKFADVPTQAEAADMLGVSERSVRTARKVLEQAEPADVEAISKGKETVSGIAKKLRGAKASEIAPPRASKTAQPAKQDVAALVHRLERAAVTAGECIELLGAHRAAVDDAILIAAEAAARAWKAVSQRASAISIANRSVRRSAS